MNRNKYSFMMLIFVLVFGMTYELLCQKLFDVIEEAQQYIERTYKGDIAQQLAKDKLRQIAIDPQKTEKDKIDEIRREFLQPKKADEITDASAYRLIWVPPLSWDIHSVAIAYDVDQSRTQVISAETVESKKTSSIEASEKGKKSATAKAVSAGASMGGGISWTNWLKINPRFEMEAHASCKTDWDDSKTELWSKQRQEQLANNFEELTKDIRSTQVTKCHLTFAIDFRNNSDEDLLFQTSATIPVYMGRTLVLNAKPENIGNADLFNIPQKGTTTIKFRGEISNTQAYKLLEYMKTNAPTILPEKGQITIFSLNNKVKNAIQESLAVKYSVICCGAYEWKVRSTWNDRRVTLREALWAVNTLYEKGPFDIESDKCVSVFDKFRCGPYPNMVKAEVYPVIEMDEHFFSILGKELLTRELPENGVRFYMDSLEAYVDSESVSKELYAVLLKDLLLVEHEDRSGEVQFLLGKMYFNGKGTTKDEAVAFKWLTKAAKQGYAKAQAGIGGCYFDGIGVEKDMSKAFEWFSKAADQGLAEAQYILGLYYLNGEGIVAEDMAKGFEWLSKAAEQGDADAQFDLGKCYFNGLGVSKDLSKAVEWVSKAAKQGLAEAQTMLGKCYYYGEGIAKDMAKAVEWYRKAAEQGDTQAQNNLGWCYDRGEGVAKDMSKAVEWYHKAAEQGDAIAQNNLGLCYHNGEGVEKNMSESIRWYSKAAEQEYSRAQDNLGLCYYLGDGVETNTAKAVEWWGKAVEQYVKTGSGEDWERALKLADMIEAWDRKAAEGWRDKANKKRPSKIVMLPNDVKLELVRIASGSFFMGSLVSEMGHNHDETLHEVTLTKSFWIGKTEVTQTQYEAVMRSNPSNFKKGGEYPVDSVTWDKAMEFCKKLTELEKSSGRLPNGYEYKLPTEAQWEYACRAGTTSAFNNGKYWTGTVVCENLTDVAWSGEDTSTHPVGLKTKNNWGLYDMHGNVCEWCYDYYDSGYYSLNRTDPQGPSNGSTHVLRGGAWYTQAASCRSAYRFHSSSTYSGFGFRVALVPIQ